MAEKSNAGRKTKMTPLVIAKLEDAFSMDTTDEEACLHAGIDPSTLYRYQQRNKKFRERKALLKKKPILAARVTIMRNMDNPNIAKWYLETKCKSEFGNTPNNVFNINANAEANSSSSCEQKAIDAQERLRELRKQRDEANASLNIEK